MTITLNDFTAGSNINLNDQIVGFNNTNVGGERRWRVATLSAIFTTNSYFSSVSTYWDSVYTSTRTTSGIWNRSTDLTTLSSTNFIDISANTSTFNNQGTIGTVTLLPATTARAGVMTAEDKYNLVQLLTAWRGGTILGDGADYLLVAGGGGGAYGKDAALADSNGGGGGGGGIIQGNIQLTQGLAFNITIGGGGIGGVSTYGNSAGENGGNSAMIGIAGPAVGGGGGGTFEDPVYRTGRDGGSGGGGGITHSTSYRGGFATTGQGFSGGYGFIGGGGGGGATEFGNRCLDSLFDNNNIHTYSAGGSGIRWFNLPGFEFAGGGGGGVSYWTASSRIGEGGLGGGGQGAVSDGSPYNDRVSLPGTINTGGGGGGGAQYSTAYNQSSGSNGGSGVLMMRWSSSSPRAISTIPSGALETVGVFGGYKYIKIKESCYLSVT